MNNTLGLNAICRIFAECICNNMGVDFTHVAQCILDHLVRLNHIGIAQANTLTQHQTLEFLIGFLSKVVRFDIQLTRERQHSLAEVIPARMSRRAKILYLVTRVIGEHHF